MPDVFQRTGNSWRNEVQLYEICSESKDTSPVKMQGIFFSEMAVLPCEIGTVLQGRVHRPVTATLCSQCVFKMAVSIQNPADFLDCIVTGDETWVSHHTLENMRQSMQWRHTHSPTAKIFKTSPSNRNIMATLFWDRKGPLLVNFLPRGDTINATVF
jgi:hypothetical protein